MERRLELSDQERAITLMRISLTQRIGAFGFLRVL